jgi:hypothetical protein
MFSYIIMMMCVIMIHSRKGNFIRGMGILGPTNRTPEVKEQRARKKEWENGVAGIP